LGCGCGGVFGGRGEVGTGLRVKLGEWRSGKGIFAHCGERDMILMIILEARI
jgi:hypothetical protein